LKEETGEVSYDGFTGAHTNFSNRIEAEKIPGHRQSVGRNLEDNISA
jgi:hypothetical protein